MASIAEIKKAIADEGKITMSCVQKSINECNEVINSRLDAIENNIAGISTRLTGIEVQLKDTVNKSQTNTDDIATVNFDLAALKGRMEELNEAAQIKNHEIETLARTLDEQIDRNMRETLIIHGIEGTERTWQETRIKLSKYISELSGNGINERDVYTSIVRAHRGGSGSKTIFAKFNDGYVMRQIKDLSVKKRGLFVNQMRSPNVTLRNQKGLAARKHLREGEGANWKLYMNDKIQLMVKRPTETRYTFYQQF